MIPDRLQDDDYFIKIKKQSQIPVGSSTEGPFYRASDPELQNWIDEGGNVGKSFLGPFLCLDIDAVDQIGELADDTLPPTFTVRSGGGGEHRYYHCPEWDRDEEFNQGQKELASIRGSRWQAIIPPSIHPETGNRYEVLHDRAIRSVGIEEIEAFTNRVEPLTERQSSDVQSGAAGGRGGGGSAHSSPSPSPGSERYWDRLTTEEALSFIQRDDYRNDIADILTLSNPPHSRRMWMVGWLYSAAGLRESEIVNLIMDYAEWGDLDRETTEKQVHSVIKSSNSERGTHYSEFTGDMAGSTAESRKTEKNPGDSSTGLNGGENAMTDFTETEEALAKESDAEGARAVKAVKVEGNDEGDEFEFVSVRRGSLRERETADGDTALIVDIDDTDGSSVGSPDDLDTVIEALEALKEKLN